MIGVGHWAMSRPYTRLTQSQAGLSCQSWHESLFYNIKYINRGVWQCFYFTFGELPCHSSLLYTVKHVSEHRLFTHQANTDYHNQSFEVVFTEMWQTSVQSFLLCVGLHWHLRKISGLLKPLICSPTYFTHLKLLHHLNGFYGLLGYKSNSNPKVLMDIPKPEKGKIHSSKTS